MKFFLLILLTLPLSALCTPKEITQSNSYYLQASTQTEITTQLALIDKALKACASPEIETSKQLLQAELTQDIQEKILFYNQALISIAEFEDRKILIQEQNKILKVLVLLYTKLDNKILADTIRKKIIVADEEKKERSYLWVIVIFAMLSLWSVFNVFRVRK